MKTLTLRPAQDVAPAGGRDYGGHLEALMNTPVGEILSGVTGDLIGRVQAESAELRTTCSRLEEANAALNARLIDIETLAGEEAQNHFEELEKAENDLYTVTLANQELAAQVTRLADELATQTTAFEVLESDLNDCLLAPAAPDAALVIADLRAEIERLQTQLSAVNRAPVTSHPRTRNYVALEDYIAKAVVGIPMHIPVTDNKQAKSYGQTMEHCFIHRRTDMVCTASYIKDSLVLVCTFMGVVRV